MKHQTILPALLLSLTASFAAPAAVQALPTVVVATAPASPAPTDTVVLKLSGQWPDGCVPEASRTNLTQEGSVLRVTFNYASVSGPCTAAVTSWSLDVAAGKLAEGSYTVDVAVLWTLMPVETIGTGAFMVAPLPEATVWLPGFAATGDTYSLASTLTAFNNADNTATVRYLGAWDALGESTAPAPVQLAPHAAGILDSRPLREGQAVQMLSLTAPRRVALRATLERLETVPEGLPKVPESLGRVELPVFTELFPAGSTAVAGDISLSALECASGPEARRRVNITLFNAGTESATFGVSATSVMTGPGGGGPEYAYEVPAKSLVQFNALSLQGLPVCDAGGAWFRITGDQPFLAYVSTVRPENLAGVLPYEIFPARADR
ncbi:MAG TPA: hypothetical protein VE129_08525 [Thermoanaerobaculia bacterium]|nr:hypothetical protein [Thermoanaerobaculia bacterium]